MKSSLRQKATPKHRSRPRGNDRPHPKTPSSGQHPCRRFLGLAAGAAALPVVSRIARAQTYPSRPITMIVPFAAGGGTDVVGRMVAERIRASLGQPVIIENVGGANGSIGVGRVARSAPDGYTLCVGVWNTHVSNGASYPLQYNVTSDFEPIGLVSIYPGLIVARNTLLANGLVGLINWLKANPDKASMGIPGAGAASHIYGLLFQKETGTQWGVVMAATLYVVLPILVLFLVVQRHIVEGIAAGAVKG